MNHTDYSTPQEYLFQISILSVHPFNLKVGEHRDIESQNYIIDYKQSSFQKLTTLYYLTFGIYNIKLGDFQASGYHVCILR